MDPVDVYRFMRRLREVGWGEAVVIEGMQRDPVSPEPVTIRLWRSPIGGDALLLLIYEDGSGLLFKPVSAKDGTPPVINGSGAER
jgi:hypothetical protein